MIAIATESGNTNARCQPTRARRGGDKSVTPAWHEGYLALLPDIWRLAHREVMHLRGDARADALQEILADTVVAYARLVEQGKVDLAYSVQLVRYAGAKLRAGRQVGNRLNINDVLSRYCQRRKGVHLRALGSGKDGEDGWKDLLAEDKHATPAEIAATRIDFQQWLKILPVHVRRVAKLLAIGESTSAVAATVGLSSARISQLRQWLRASWYSFIGEPV